MAGDETKIQAFILALERGGLAKVVQVLVIVIATIGLALAYLFIQFRGLSTAAGMDQAQIAREIARGKGFSTKTIRPLAVQQFQQANGQIPTGNFPDSYHAPLNPLVNALVIYFFPNELTRRLDASNLVFGGDRLIAAVSVFFFLVSVILTYFLARNLFDHRLALVACTLVLLADQFWQFSLSGLPQMFLLFLLICAVWCLVAAIRAKNNGRNPFLWIVFLGFFLGLSALAHPLTLWISAGAVIFCGIYFRPRVRMGLIPAVLCLALFSVWVIRNYQITKTPFGISPVALLDGVVLSEDGWMRQGEADTPKVNPTMFRTKIQNDFKDQIGRLYQLLGGIVVAPLFFVSLLHRFKRSEVEAFKWALLLMWLFTFAGTVLIGTGDGTIGPNQIHILFSPLMTLYGLALLLVLWNRLELGVPIFRHALFTLLFVITGLPSIFGFLPGNPRIQFPPYLPEVMQLFRSWTQPTEIIVSDMPSAVAWYSDRKSLWLPYTVSQFNSFYDFERLGGPIVGVYLTPVSRDLGFGSHIASGEYKDWAGLILPSLDLIPNFPLRTTIGIAGNQCLYFSDRARWNERR